MSDAMQAARDALKAKGFTEAGDVYTSTRGDVERTRYEAVDGGFKRYFKGEAMLHSVLPEWQGVSGLDGANPAQAACFQWVWPPEDIATIYG